MDGGETKKSVFVLIPFVVLFVPGVRVLSAEKQPVPPRLEQEEHEKEIRELFKAEYARRGAAGGRALAGKLLARGTGERDPAARYVLLQEARQAAAKAGDLDKALAAVEALLRGYEIDPLPLRAETLSSLKDPPGDLKVLGALIPAYLDLVEDALFEDSYKIADKAAAGAVSAARKARNPFLYRVAKEFRTHGKKVKREHDKLQETILSLRESPEDPEANLAVGKFLCFYKGAWKRGLPLLGKGSDAELRSFAEREEREPQDAVDRATLADDWLAQAKKVDSPARDYIQARAIHWYDRCMAGLPGLRRRRVQGIMKDLATSTNFYLPGVKENFARRFDGKDDLLIVPTLRYEGVHPITLEAFVVPYPTTGNWRTVVGNCQTSGVTLSVRDGKWVFWYYVGRQWVKLLSKDPVVPYRRVHLAGVFDGRQTRFYVDGHLQGKPAPIKGAHRTSEHPFMVGADPDTGMDVAEGYFPGIIDEVRISRVARYAKNFTPRPVLVPDSDTLVLFHMDREEGGKARDSSPNGYHAEIRGTARVNFR